MQGKFKLEQIWTWQHVGIAEDSLSNFPVPEASEKVEIKEILDHEADISLDDIEWLLRQWRDKFQLFVRGYQDPGDEHITGDKVKESYPDMPPYLRYVPPSGSQEVEIVWPLAKIEDFDSIPQSWRERAVLAIRKGDNPGEYNLQVLCSIPYSGAALDCDAYCNPPEDSMAEELCRLYGCI